MQSNEDILAFILNFMSEKTSNTVIKTWFSDAKIHEFTENRLVLSTPADFKRDIINARYVDLLKEALLELFGQNLDVEVILPDKLHQRNMPPDVKNFVFDDFIVGESNKLAYAASVAVSENPGKIYNPLLLYGESGLGKTHLLYAIMHNIKGDNPDFKVLATTAEKFINEFTSSIQFNRRSEFKSKHREIDLLLVDDIQFIAGKDASQEEFFHTFNALYESGKQIVITSDRPPRDMKLLEERLRTRFEWGLMLDIQQPDYETRLAIIRSKAARGGITLPEEVIQYIAETITDNIRQLEGTVKKMIAYRDLTGDIIDINQAKRAIADFIHENPGLNPTPEIILREVGVFFNLEQKEILGKKRNADLVHARQVAMYLMRNMTTMSLNDIGDDVFNKDHTTVMHSIDKIEQNRKEDTKLDEDIKTIMENIRNI